MSKAMGKNRTDAKKTKKRGKKIMTVLLAVIGVIISINLISFFVNQVFFSKELDGIEPYGQLVDIDGRKMHIRSMGSGETTIVILPGMGMPVPSADFGPLMRALSENYTVVVVEYFGYGFSDQTDAPRTNANITEEIRLALSLAGFPPPYVLMPHSVSGIYSEYFATKYPNEVAAIIMLDTTSSAEPVLENIPDFVYTITKAQQAIGLERLWSPLIVTKVLGIDGRYGHNSDEIAYFKLFYNHRNNDTTIDQLRRNAENIAEVMEMGFPSNIPVLKIIASEQNPGVSGDYHKNHMARLGENAKLITLEGTHFIYHMAVEEIVEATISFLESGAR